MSPRSIVVRALARSAFAALGLFLAVGIGRDPLLVALHGVAAIAGATVVQGLLVARSVRRATPAWTCALQVGPACVALHLAAAGNVVWWLGAPSLDPQARADAAGRLLVDGGVVLALRLVGLAWTVATPSFVLAYLERRRSRGVGDALPPLLAWAGGQAALGVALKLAIARLNGSAMAVELLAAIPWLLVGTAAWCVVGGVLTVLVGVVDELADRLAPEAGARSP